MRFILLLCCEKKDEIFLIKSTKQTVGNSSLTIGLNYQYAK